jgi:maleylacetate reductase
MTPRTFIHDQLSARVVFGPGRLDELPAEVDRLGTRVLVLATRTEESVTDRAVALLGGRAITRWDDVHRHVPAALAERAATHAKHNQVDVLVSIGGGSTTGLAKAVARRTGLPVLAVPTTYAGSEMTPIWGETEHNHKVTGRAAAALPRTVIYDPELTVTLPAPVSAASGMNALAHCIEALYAPGANPLNSAQATLGIHELVGALPRVVRDPADLDARADALIGAWLAGSVLASAGISVHHHVCHVLGGMFDLPHAELHAIVLPHALRLTLPRIGATARRIAAALGAADVTDVPRTVQRLSDRLGLRTALAQVGMTRGDLTPAISPCVRATSTDVANPTEATARTLLHDAFVGRTT